MQTTTPRHERQAAVATQAGRGDLPPPPHPAKGGLVPALRAAVRCCVLAGALTPSLPAAGSELTEVNLRATLDEPRGYCIDMIGYKERARTDRPLQAHTCYSYQGQIAPDQAAERALALRGRFRFPHFGVCMAASHLSPGAQLVLAECAERSNQTFRFKPSGEIAPAAAPTLCVTVADGPGIAGGGGQPVHLLRPLSLEACSAEAETRQRWRLLPPGK